MNKGSNVVVERMVGPDLDDTDVWFDRFQG